MSTGQGCAQRTAGGGRRALTRAERRGRSSVPRSLHEGSDCSRIFGLVRGAVTAPGHHGNPRAGSHSLARPRRPAVVIGSSPRRSDRCAMMRALGAVLRARTGGEARLRVSVLGRERAVLRPDRPDDPGELVRDGHRRDVVPAPLFGAARAHRCNDVGARPPSRARKPIARRASAACAHTRRLAC